MKRLLLITFSVFFTLSIISCSDSSTGSDPEPEPGPEQTTGTLEITTNTSGSDQDSDGYTLTFDGSDQSIGINETVTFEEQEEGSYEAELNDIADNCAIDGENPRDVEVFPEDYNSTTFDISCESQSSGGVSALTNKIVFSSDRPDDDNFSDIFVMEADGSNHQRLTDTGGAFDGAPSVSNDGTQIAFFSLRNSVAGNIYIMNADGTGVEKLTDSDGSSRFTSWSPDDSKIVFADNRTDSNDIYIINTDGSGEKRLTEEDFYDDRQPDWSPDGDRIIFSGEEDGDFEIYTMNTDGGDLKQLTDNSSFDGYPRWSPDGSQIVFSSEREGDSEIYTMSIDEETVRRVTNSSGIKNKPTWSPDGSEIVYQYKTEELNSEEIYKINADGSGSPTELTNNESSQDEAPFWSPVE